MTINEKPALKVFLYGYYGFGNVGDDLLLQAIIKKIREYSSGARFVIRSFAPVDAVRQDPRVIFGNFEKLLSDPTRHKLHRLVAYCIRIWQALKGCDMLIFGGGTLFHATGRSNLILLLLITLMARMRGAKVFAVGVGVAIVPAGLQSILLRIILYLSEDVAVRDLTSQQNCLRLTKITKVRHTADLVYSLPIQQSINYHTHKIGITLAASDIPHQKALINSAAALRDGVRALQKSGWIPVFISFQELDSDNLTLSDSALCREIFGCDQELPVEYQYASSDPTVLADQMRSMDLVFGMRFHSLVIAALLGKPFVGFGGDEKLRDICIEFGMPFISAADISTASILSSVSAAASKRPDPITLAKLRTKAESNFIAILESLKCA